MVFKATSPENITKGTRAVGEEDRGLSVEVLQSMRSQRSGSSSNGNGEETKIRYKEKQMRMHAIIMDEVIINCFKWY